MKQQLGFTLIELIVASGVFIIVMTVASGIFIANNQAGERTRTLQKLHGNLNFIFEKMVREIQFGKIDYDAARDENNNPMERIQLKNNSGQKIEYVVSKFIANGDTFCEIGTIGSCVLMGVDMDHDEQIESTEYTYLTGKEMLLSSFQAYITPSNDPFLEVNGVYASSSQPQVTLLLSMSSPSNRDEPAQRVSLQTTIVSRSYER